METERFEALIDAILAIILTIIILEIPMAETGSWQSLAHEGMEFVIYAVSFIVVFNYWNFNNNIFSIVNKIDHRVIWATAVSLFVMSLLPYLTTFVAENFYSFLAQTMYALDFLVTAVITLIIGKYLKEADKGNIALQIALTNHKGIYLTIILIIIAEIIGYFVYPPAIIISCLVSIFGVWLVPHLSK